MKRIYCVEDDENIRELISYALKNAGFEVYTFESAPPFYAALLDRPSLVLLDIMLPGEDGITILKKLREDAKTKELPVILLTAKGAEYDKIKGLDTGADDYITKPFSVLELISRIHAVLRRSHTHVAETLSFGGIALDLKRRSVTAEGEEITLTLKEFELLSYLMRNVNIVLTREKLLNEVWGFDYEGETRTVDVHIKTLRQKLNRCGDVIKTVRGVGYKVGD